jgi:hypothetical protein
MARFNAAKIFDAVDKKFQQVYNQLIDLLDTGYNTVAMVNGKKVEVTVSPQKPFELIIDGIKEIYVTEAGVLVTSRYDVNEDGIVDQKDIDLVIAYIATGTGYLPRMDVNGDGRVNSIDLTLIYQHAVWTFDSPPPSIPETVENISYVHRAANTSMELNQWYRIAIESGLYDVGDGNVTRNSGLFEIDWTGTGVYGFASFYACNMYNNAGSIELSQLAFSAVGAGFTKARIVYKNGDATGEITAVELYLSSAIALTTNINITNPIGWTYHLIDGDVPAGYTTTELTFS